MLLKQYVKYYVIGLICLSFFSTVESACCYLYDILILQVCYNRIFLCNNSGSWWAFIGACRVYCTSAGASLFKKMHV